MNFDFGIIVPKIIIRFSQFDYHNIKRRLIMAQKTNKAPVGYDDTPMIPGSAWRVHDGTRPQPKVVTPGTFSSEDKPGQPPSDAIVLFDGKDLSKWIGRDGEPQWQVENG